MFLQQKLDFIRLQNYTTFTGHALKKTAEDFRAYGRDGAEKVMILLTDGKLVFFINYIN